ncbi:hypothetical protein MFRU_004g03490 [Monilinia fructicola]|uniref:Glucose-methanol-choline oxidoreductase N-terminal domain-containing protein n=1 Tax=Monilinia fructicola TaxID=38448 RepID=A0A5M9JPB0_MONFR|nr:hypothetical protein EYC84_001225 [Monilinia fructicola]KAG4033849.1 hypothetical protein MFRU_004g03490 [Monilinia fructicola]
MVPKLRESSVWLWFLASCRPVACLTSSYPRDEPVFAESYDYIIVGGGTSGLVVANRLSEDPEKTVLVIEHGLIDNSSLTLVPRLGIQYFPNNVKNWEYTSAPVESLLNATFDVYIADVVGGSSLHNGMFADRGSRADYDSWGAFVDDDTWSWDGLYPYFVKSSTFTPPSAELVEQFDIKNNASAYGDGPLQISYPSVIFPDYRNLTLAANAVGIKTSDGPESGDATGFCWVPQTLDPATGFRSHSRIAYYDPVASRPNLQLVTGHLVERILFDQGLTATGVRVTSLQSNKTNIVTASREVILAAGAINTPKLLQLSGIGPKKVLNAAGVEVLLDKPAVGANFQDHPVTYLSWNLTNLAFPNDGTISTNASYNASAWQEYVTNHTGPYTQAASPDAAFLPLSQFLSQTQEFIDQLRAQNASDFLPSIYEDETLLKGYLAQRDILLDHFGRTDAAAIEIPITATGPGACAIEKPLSRGTITLNPHSPHSQPIITYNTLSNPLDGLLLSECIRYVRTYYASPLLTNYHPTELAPGPQAQSDEEILSALISNRAIAPSFAHPSGTCALGTEEYGGCVGADLRVWGTGALSVVDASIMPLIPATHLQLTVYAVAEKAADIIKGRG